MGAGLAEVWSPTIEPVFIAMAPLDVAPDCIEPVLADVDIEVLSVAGGETVEGVGPMALGGMVEDWSEFEGEGGFA